jgi:hypothetical protein
VEVTVNALRGGGGGGGGSSDIRQKRIKKFKRVFTFTPI